MFFSLVEKCPKLLEVVIFVSFGADFRVVGNVSATLLLFWRGNMAVIFGALLVKNRRSSPLELLVLPSL